MAPGRSGLSAGLQEKREEIWKRPRFIGSRFVYYLIYSFPGPQSGFQSSLHEGLSTKLQLRIKFYFISHGSDFLYLPPLEPWRKGRTGHGAEMGKGCPSTRVILVPSVVWTLLLSLWFWWGPFGQLFLEAKALARALGKTEADLGVVCF